MDSVGLLGNATALARGGACDAGARGGEEAAGMVVLGSKAAWVPEPPHPPGWRPARTVWRTAADRSRHALRGGAGRPGWAQPRPAPGGSSRSTVDHRAAAGPAA